VISLLANKQIKGARIKEFRINREIQAPEMLVISADKKQLGIKSLYEALRLAEEQNLDLIEVGPNASPPVARIMDYGKYRYELEKKQKTQSKRTTDVKEIRLSINIDEHDWQVKLERAKKFMAQSGKVKVEIKLMGRQMLFIDKATERLNQFREELGGEFESPPQRLGKRFVVLIKKGKEDGKAKAQNS